MNDINKILEDAEKNGINEEIVDYIDNLEEEKVNLEEENVNLKKENRILKRGGSPSEVKRLKESNANLKKKNRKMSNLVTKLKKNKDPEYAHLNEEKLGVYSRMLEDFNFDTFRTVNKFPKHDHPIFNHFYELATQYPNRAFLLSSIKDIIDEKIKLVDFEINTQLKNIKALDECAVTVSEHPNDWQDLVNDDIARLYNLTTTEELNKKVEQLEKSKVEIAKWVNVQKGIPMPPVTTDVKKKNNLYYEILDEFNKLFDFCSNVGGIYQYKANIIVTGFDKTSIHSALTEELQKQIGLCEEPYSHTFYFSNGEGRLVPYKIDRRLLGYIQNNTTFMKLGKQNQYRKGNIIDSDNLFKDIPKYVNKVQYKNANLVGFNNVFYNVRESEIQRLNPQAPIMPLKNTKTELYLDKDIEDNAMRQIFMQCFTEQDRKTLLAYIGCCLYDKGYTQRQESIFLMSKGGTGKTTFVRAICEIFYSWESQLVSKLSDERFGFSMFANNDCVIVDEVQSAKADFAEVLKNLSTGSNLVVEQKNIDTINIPAENVPRSWFIGNQFSKALYDASSGEGVYRRILCIIPIKAMQELGYKWEELITDSCKQWLVQQATKEYVNQGLHKKAIPIQTISDAEKKARMEMCTFPERHFILKHFQVAYLDSGEIDHSERLYYQPLFNFINQELNKQMLESTIKEENNQRFIEEVKKALKLPKEYHTKSEHGQIFFTGIVPKTDEAIEFLNETE